MSLPFPMSPVSRLGDLWLLGSHRLLCGDSTKADDVAWVLGSVKPHLMITDPPFGVNYDPSWRNQRGLNHSAGKLGRVTNDDRADWREAWALFGGDVAYVWHATWFTSTVQASLEDAGFQIRSQIIWAKDRFALSRGHYHWQHEPCFYAVRGTAHWTGDRSQSTLWNIPSREDRGHGHGTQKPVECMRRPMLNNSSPGQAVYEPFCGSGTTIIAAETIGRVCHAIEIEPAYVDVAIERWQAFTGKAAVLEGGDRSFAEVAAERHAEKRTTLEARGRPAGGDMTTKADILRSIRQKCLDCSCFQPSEVRDCRLMECSLWPFRFGSDPEPGPARGCAKPSLPREELGNEQRARLSIRPDTAQANERPLPRGRFAEANPE